jgi:histone H3/H4
LITTNTQHTQPGNRRADAAAAADGDGDGDGDGPEARDAGASGADVASTSALPRGLVKRIMLLDSDVSRVSADALWLMGEAARLFLQELAARGGAAVAAKKRKTIQLADFDQLVRCVRRCALGARPAP